MQKNETEHLYHTQNSTQNLKDLKTRSETVKSLEENKRKHHDISICKYFLTLIRKEQAAKPHLTSRPHVIWKRNKLCYCEPAIFGDYLLLQHNPVTASRTVTNDFFLSRLGH